MKILIPILGFAKSGGMRVLSELGNYFSKKGNNVYYITHYYSQKPYFPVKGKLIFVNSDGIENSVEKKKHKNGILNVLAILNYLKRTNEKFDVIIANHWTTAYSVAFSGYAAKKIYYIQAYEPEFNQKFVKKLLAKLSYTLPLKQIVNSHIYIDYKNIKGKDIVYPGLDLNNFYPKEYKNFSNEIIIGTIGRPLLWKGTKDVIDAFKILKSYDNENRFYLKIAYDDLNEKVDGLCCVTPQNDKELAEYYRSIDIMVAPGHIQLGAVHYPVIESMACGTPVVTTGYYPADNKKNAWIIPIKEPRKIAECIMYMIKNQKIVKEKREQAIQDIQQFDWNIVSENFLKIIEES